MLQTSDAMFQNISELLYQSIVCIKRVYMAWFLIMFRYEKQSFVCECCMHCFLPTEFIQGGKQQSYPVSQRETKINPHDLYGLSVFQSFQLFTVRLTPSSLLRRNMDISSTVSYQIFSSLKTSLSYVNRFQLHFLMREFQCHNFWLPGKLIRTRINWNNILSRT